MNARDDLLEMVSIKDFSDNPEVLERYSKDFGVSFGDGGNPSPV